MDRSQKKLNNKQQKTCHAVVQSRAVYSYELVWPLVPWKS